MNSSDDLSGRSAPTPGSGSAANTSALGAGLVLAAAVLFAINGPISKTVLTSGLDPQQLVSIRSVGAAAGFFVIATVRRPSSLRVGARELLWIAGFGLIGLAAVNWLYFVALTRMPVSVTLLIEFTAPLWVALWARFVRKETVRSRIWVALLLALGGLILVARVWAGLTLDLIGLMASVAAALCLAAYYVMGERGLSTRDSYSLAAYSFTASAMAWAVVIPWWRFPFTALTKAAPLRMVSIGWSASLPVGVLVAWVIVMGTLAPYSLMLAGLRRIGPTRTGLVGTSEPPMAGVLSWLWLGEALAPVQILGAGIVLTGIVLAETAREPKTPPVPDGPVGEASPDEFQGVTLAKRAAP